MKRPLTGTTMDLLAELTTKSHGERAEEEFSSYLTSAMKKLTKKFNIYRSLRVPKSKSSGKSEIDFILLTESALVAIEVKSWGGQVHALPNGKWSQKRRDKDLIHDDAAALNSEKLEAIREFFKHEGMLLDAAYCHSWVVFTGNVTLDSAISQLPGSILLRQLDQRLKDIVPAQPTAWAISKALLGFGRSRPFSFAKVGEKLSQLPTWDCVTLRDGSNITGDFDNFSLISKGGIPITRVEAQTITFIEKRGLRGLLFGHQADIRRYSGSNCRMPINFPEHSLNIYLAGQKQLVQIAMADVSKVSFGRKDHSSYVSQGSADQFAIGDLKDGFVTSISEFGVFVRIGVYQDGLIHLSNLIEMKLTDFSVNQKLRVSIAEIESRNGKKRISLRVV
jgi:hypothetical protein